jgi:hypothetical protein
MRKRQYMTGRCLDCGEPCSDRAERCRSCRERFRWRNPDDPRRVPPYPLTPEDALWPTCACGCGEPAPARKANDNVRGFVKGEPCRYVAGHFARTKIKLPQNGLYHCSCCDQVLPVEEFHREKGRPSGLSPHCRHCVKKRTAQWAAENPDRRRLTAKLYREANPEVAKRALARYRKTEKAARQARKNVAKRRARKKAQFVEDVDPAVVFERDKGICGICKEPADPTNFHVDHIRPLAKGGEHSYANTQVAHPACNCAKRDRLDYELA